MSVSYVFSHRICLFCIMYGKKFKNNFVLRKHLRTKIIYIFVLLKEFRIWKKTYLLMLRWLFCSGFVIVHGTDEKHCCTDLALKLPLPLLFLDTINKCFGYGQIWILA